MAPTRQTFCNKGKLLQMWHSHHRRCRCKALHVACVSYGTEGFRAFTVSSGTCAGRRRPRRGSSRNRCRGAGERLHKRALALAHVEHGVWPLGAQPARSEVLLTNCII